MPGEQEQDRREERQSSWSQMRWYLALFFVANFVFSNFVMPKQPQIPTPKTPEEEISLAAKAGHDSLVLYPLWKQGTKFDMDIYLSDVGTPLDVTSEVPVLSAYGIDLLEKSDIATQKVTVPLSDKVKNNGTLYAHFFLQRQYTAEELAESHGERYRVGDILYTIRPISEYNEKKKTVKKKNLLAEDDGGETEPAEPESGAVIVPHYHPNVTIGLVKFYDPLVVQKTHPIVLNHFTEEKNLRVPNTEGKGQVGYYYPPVWHNKFWGLPSQMKEINATTDEVTLNFHVQVANFWKFQILETMDFGFKQQAQSGQDSGAAAGIEELKRILTETNPYLLAVTVVVSLLHTLFEFLAFKNDISHWKNKKDTIGVSVRTIIANVVMQFITFLYLFDNSENTNAMVLLTQGMGILVEAWKITKAVDIKFNEDGKWISFHDKHELSDVEKKTKEYDEIVFRYLFWVALPLILAYAGYSLVYQEHKSWPSFLITVAVQCVYAYGFLLLIPPVYINYRLKSVAHMSTRAMIYKTLNTFIDDLFSFVIKMPWLHRLMTLRDDVIFVVYLYQSWAYRTDYSRVNELGLGGEEEDESSSSSSASSSTSSTSSTSSEGEEDKKTK